MATPVIREAVVNSTATTSTTTTTAAGTAVNDLLVAFHGVNYSGATGGTSPGGTAGTWTLRASYYLNSDNAFIWCWTRPVTVAGAQTVTTTITGTATYGNYCGVLVLTGADLTSPIDGTPTTVTAGGASAVLPAVTTTATDSLLVAGLTCTSLTSTNYTFTPPGTMTERWDRNQHGGGFTCATQALTSAGSTGTRTFTASGSTFDMCGAMLAIRGASGRPAQFMPFFR